MKDGVINLIASSVRNKNGLIGLNYDIGRINKLFGLKVLHFK